MEKTIKMSLETAQKMWRLWKQNLMQDCVKDFLLENFTKEELEGKKGFTWEDSFGGHGWWIEPCSKIYESGNINVNDMNKHIFKTEAQAKSALAFAQLSHIVAKYNEGKKQNKVTQGYCYLHEIQGTVNKNLAVISIPMKETVDRRMPVLYFLTEEDAQLSKEMNKELWLQYHCIWYV